MLIVNRKMASFNFCRPIFSQNVYNYGSFINHSLMQSQKYVRVIKTPFVHFKTTIHTIYRISDGLTSFSKTSPIEPFRKSWTSRRDHGDLSSPSLITVQVFLRNLSNRWFDFEQKHVFSFEKCWTLRVGKGEKFETWGLEREETSQSNVE